MIVQRSLLVSLLVYLPHLVDEHCSGMWSDPLVGRMFAPLADLAPRQGMYLVFQAMFALSLCMAYLVSRGPRTARFALVPLAVALTVEAHHLVRAILDGAMNPGLFTSLPMPILGVWLLRRLLGARSPEASHQQG